MNGDVIVTSSTGVSYVTRPTIPVPFKCDGTCPGAYTPGQCSGEYWHTSEITDG